MFRLHISIFVVNLGMNDLKSSTKVLLSHDPNYALEIYIIYLSFRIKLTVRSNCKKI